jgi:hypothetical protein
MRPRLVQVARLLEAPGDVVRQSPGRSGYTEPEVVRKDHEISMRIALIGMPQVYLVHSRQRA